MRVFHGSNVDIVEVDLNLCRKYTDFGKGFYLTMSLEQAKARAASKVNVYGGHPIITVWEYDNSDTYYNQLKVKEFKNETSDWADFVYRSRELGEENDYDIVIGPVADDNLRYLFRNVRLGLLSIQELSNRLTYKQKTTQICFRTQRSLKLLKKI